MRITLQNIRMILQSAAEKGLTEKELLSALNQKRKKLALLRKALSRLTRSEQCIKLNGRYLIQAKSQVKPKRKHRSPESDKRVKPKHSKKPILPNGIVIHNKSGLEIFSLIENRTFRLDSEQAKNLIHGDTVRYKLLHDNTNRPVAYVTSMVERKTNIVAGKITTRLKKQLRFIAMNRSRFPQEFRVKGYSSNKDLTKSRVLLRVSQFPTSNNAAVGEITHVLPDSPMEMAEMEDILSEKKSSLSFLIKS